MFGNAMTVLLTNEHINLDASTILNAGVYLEGFTYISTVSYSQLSILNY